MSTYLKGVRRGRQRIILALVAAGVCAWASGAAEAGLMAVERGLPVVNLNKPAGEDRSNVRWSYSPNHMMGDDFTLDECEDPYWEVQTVRVWTAPAEREQLGGNPDYLGDFFTDLTLFLGVGNDDLEPVATGTLAVGSNVTSNPDIHVTETTYVNGEGYERTATSVPKYSKMYELEFTNLGWIVPCGSIVSFGVNGPSRDDPLDHFWYLLGANAGLAGTTQEDADDLMRIYAIDGTFIGFFDGSLNGWPVPSDVNVEVEAVPAPEPATLALVAVGALALARRRRR